MNQKTVRFLNRATAYFFVLPSFLVVMLVVAYPILNSILRSFRERKTHKFTLENYTYFFTNPLERGSILFTLGVVVSTVLIAMVVAYLLAMYLRFTKSRTSKLIGALYLIPRFIPGLVAIYGMMVIIRDSGLLNRVSLV
ncbi:MAG: ABC transporter permease, partial [Treponema sp.]|nr:ABC transporter permease [Treponema sp.]